MNGWAVGKIENQLTRSQKRAQRTLRALLDAGEAVFGESGFQQVTIAEITERADVALGSFYNYFENREALISAILQEAYESQLALSRFVLAQEHSPVRRVTAPFASQIHRARLDPTWSSFCDTAAVARRWPHPSWRSRAEIEIDKGRADGVFDFQDLEWITELVLSVSRTAFDPSVRSRSWPIDEEIATVLGSLLRILGTANKDIRATIEWAIDIPVDLDLVQKARSVDVSAPQVNRFR